MAISSGNNVNNISNVATGLATDASSVNDLKQAARKDPNSPEAIRGAAKQFEALFLNMVMKSMRDATPHEGPFDSEQSKMFTSMLDQQMSQSLAQRGVGLADVLTRQLSKGIASPAADPTQDENQASVASDPAMAIAKAAETARSLPFGINSLASRRNAAGSDDSQAMLPINKALMDNAAATDQNGRGPGGRRGARPAHVEAFQSDMTPAAEEASKTTGIPAKFMMAQAALESGWGKHVIRNADGSSSNNLFGIKATAGWKGKVVEATTTEYVHGVATRKVEKFRAYDTPADSFRDYASLLRNNPRYEKVLASAQDMSGFAQGLQRAGYATDPRYAEKLTRIIKQS
ncbi:flagellar assembly peptidoglycan hydrolase FlgJ [Oxalobacteraceae bacterium CAVE-383]|nr:flagellar assembly peptidoglycan hydrolase FlgJ [Oxalobacteraceae bacterium CAVE-383]